MRTPYYLRAKLNRSAIFAQMMRRAFPGDGRMSGGVVRHADQEMPVVAGVSATEHTGCLQESMGSGDGSGQQVQILPAQNFITEADIAAKVQNTVGTGPDFDTLLTDPDYDRRATAIPAAREEQE